MRAWVNGKKHFQIMVYNFRKEKKIRPFHFKGWSYSNFMDGGKSRKLHSLDNSALIVLWPWPIYLNLHLPKMSFWNVLWEFSGGGGGGVVTSIQGLFKINITLEVKSKRREHGASSQSTILWYPGFFLSPLHSPSSFMSLRVENESFSK